MLPVVATYAQTQPVQSSKEDAQPSQSEMLGVGVASIKRWELGLIQDRKNDRLLREFAGEFAAHRSSYEWCGNDKVVVNVELFAESGVFAYAA
jgi:hypothetical protein